MNHPLDDSPTLLHAVTGSQVHGTATASSDVDITRVRVLPTEKLAGLRPVRANEHQRHTTTGPLDVTDIDVATFLCHVLDGSAKHFEVMYSPLVSPGHELGATMVTARDRLVTQDAVRRAYLGYLTALAKTIADRGPKLNKELRVLHRLADQATQLWTTGDLHLNATDPSAPRAFADRVTAGADHLVPELVESTARTLESPSPLPTDTDLATHLAADLVTSARAWADRAAA